MNAVANHPKATIRCGDVYLMNFGNASPDQRGLRPGVVIQNNIGNLHSPNIIALPLTTSLKKLNMPTHVLLRADDTGLLYDSMVLAENPKCLSKTDVGAYITTLSDQHMKEIAVAHLMATAALSYLDDDMLASLKEQAAKLNTVA